MPQIFQVLRCYKCSIFQIHQTRKDNKWVCKVCGEKQSVKRHYGIGTGKDCRMHVQKLNSMRGEKEEAIKTCISDDGDCDEALECSMKNDAMNNKYLINKKSKWSTYIEEPQDVDSNTPEYIDNLEVVLEVPQKRKLNKTYNNNTKYFKQWEDCARSFKTNNCDNFESISSTEINYEIKPTEAPPQDNNLSRISGSMLLKNDKSLKPQSNNLDKESIKKTSKWAQFIEDDKYETSNAENVESSPKKDSLFSLCDDEDIDNILDL
ncbi:unnamed protein product, partial [Brenthis ino]